MARIAIVTNKIIRGGVEKALINLLNSENFKDKNIDLYLLDVTGEWTYKLPSNVNIIHIERLKIDSISNLLRYIFSYVRMRTSNNYCKLCFYNSRLLKDVDVLYDEVISYHAPGTIPVFYSLYNLIGKKKIIYIHGDVNMCKCNTQYMLRKYEQFNSIRCVSQDCYKVFIDTFPSLINKTIIEYNVIDINEIVSLSKEPIYELRDGYFNIVTVARLSVEKGIDLAIETMKNLKLVDFPIKWYIVGEGDYRQQLEIKIEEYKLNDVFILLGAKDNPYPYIKRSQLYVQPSIHEGFCLTLAEALILEKYCICTPFSGAYEQIDIGKNGEIVKYDVTELTNAILNYANNYYA